ncbi:MAG: DUF4422 domain-containing protein [Clostridia bacterium]|nr:DUF4422 domain-containing protein [Clostridia bacterium]
MRIVMAVAMHRPCAVPDAPPYLPVQAGAACNAPLNVQRDDEGQHISARNPLYCELTVHYWLWQNVEADAYGLCHYRRYFMHPSRKARSNGSLPEGAGCRRQTEGVLPEGVGCRRQTEGVLSEGVGCRRQTEGVLTGAQAEALLADADVLVPRPRIYLIETNWSHYAHAHRESDLTHLRAVIADTCPDYLPAFDRVMKRRWGRRFNMFIMRRAWFESYSAWIFPVLFALEERLGSDIPPRTMGFIAERLLDVWLEHTRPRIRQLPVLHTEGQQWPKKITGFLRRKFCPRKM